MPAIRSKATALLQSTGLEDVCAKVDFGYIPQTGYILWTVQCHSGFLVLKGNPARFSE